MAKIEVGKTYRLKVSPVIYDVLMAHVDKAGLKGFICYTHGTRKYTFLVGNLENYEEVHVPVVTYSYNLAVSCSEASGRLTAPTIWSAYRNRSDNIKATFRDDILTSVEVIKPPIIEPTPTPASPAAWTRSKSKEDILL